MIHYNTNCSLNKPLRTLLTLCVELHPCYPLICNTGTCGKCLPGWNLLNSSCYFFSYLESSTVKKNWADSRADCVRRGADLVVIDTPEEQTSTKIWDNGFWIGITDMQSEGTWTWINNVTGLDRREPNNYGRGEDCGVILYSSISPWKTMFDGPCNYPYHWVCKMDSR
uniref:C-type lectin domain-containing protein n=1 Tax=Anabas testudineus TaxID=64144 RepID=A0A7N6B196_ANATE